MNIEAINKWLDEEYGCSFTRLEELHDYYFEKYCDLKQENKKYKEVGNTYKKRCQLAIEYIESKEYEYGDEEQDNYIYDIGFDEVNELLDILKGMK